MIGLTLLYSTLLLSLSLSLFLSLSPFEPLVGVELKTGMMNARDSHPPATTDEPTPQSGDGSTIIQYA